MTDEVGMVEVLRLFVLDDCMDSLRVDVRSADLEDCAVWLRVDVGLTLEIDPVDTETLETDVCERGSTAEAELEAADEDLLWERVEVPDAVANDEVRETDKRETED